MLEADLADEEQDTVPAKSLARNIAVGLRSKTFQFQMIFIETDILEATDVEIAESVAKKVGGDWAVY